MGKKSRRRRKQLSTRQQRAPNVEKASQGAFDFADPEFREMAAYRAEVFVGPFPHPEIMARYDQIVPGMAQTLVDGFERQSEHRMQLEKMAIKNNIVQTYVGQASAFNDLT